MKKPLLVAILFSLTLWLGACGQKGPLFLPPKQAEQAPQTTIPKTLETGEEAESDDTD